MLEQYTVTGVRASLATAQEIKQNSPEIVDSVVAQDIGKLPDNTVADALQHMPGIQVSRAAGEASTVVIRGLPNLETTINGYEVFTGTSRLVALQDIPAELVAGIDVYKSIGPDKVEGGVAGLIDVRLHRPFDFKEGLTLAGNGRGGYGTQSKKYSYHLSGLASERWKLGNGGDFGLLLDVSYADVKYEDQVVDNYVHFGANGEQFDLATDPSGVRGYYADNFGIQLSPGNRKRAGVSLMLQWKPTAETEIYWDNLYTRYENQHITDFFIGIPSWANAGFYINNVSLYPVGYQGYNVPEKYDNLGTPARFVHSLTAHNTNTLTSKQSYHDKTDTYQGAVGGRLDNGTVKATAELSYNVSTFRPRSVILDTGTVTPSFSITYNDGGAASVNATGIDYTDVNNFFLTQLFDQWQRSHSVQYALRADVLYRLKAGLLQSVQVGARYSDRDVNYHSANNGGIFRWDAAKASSIPGLGRISTHEPFIGSGQINVRHWWSADENFLMNQTDTLRAIFGQPNGLPPADPSRTFKDSEKTYALYGQGNYDLHLGDLPLDGILGVRGVQTKDTLTGFQRQTVGSSTTGSYVLTSVGRNRWEWLPMINGRLHLAPDLLLRGSVTKTFTRPDFAALNPALSLTSPGPTLPGQGSGGNPDLSPIKSTNYDLSLEYYPTRTTQATVAGFYRTLDGYIQSYGAPETIGDTTYTVTRPRSTHNGYLEGVESTFQYFFDFLPETFKGLGLQANYTYIKGETEDPITGIKAPIAQVSKDNYNLILIYERGAFSSRLAYNWRGRFIDSFNQSGIQPTTVWVQPTKRLDFSASYAITENFLVTFDATNILKSKYHDNFGNYTMFSRDVRSYDTTYEVGVRVRL